MNVTALNLTDCHVFFSLFCPSPLVISDARQQRASTGSCPASATGACQAKQPWSWALCGECEPSQQANLTLQTSSVQMEVRVNAICFAFIQTERY